MPSDQPNVVGQTVTEAPIVLQQTGGLAKLVQRAGGVELHKKRHFASRVALVFGVGHRQLRIQLRQRLAALNQDRQAVRRLAGGLELESVGRLTAVLGTCREGMHAIRHVACAQRVAGVGAEAQHVPRGHRDDRVEAEVDAGTARDAHDVLGLEVRRDKRGTQVFQQILAAGVGNIGTGAHVRLRDDGELDATIG